MKNIQSSAIKFSLVLIILVCCAILGYISYNWVLTTRQTNMLHAFAQQYFEYTPENQLAEYETCWDMFPSRCGLVLYYTTTANQDEFQAQIDNLAETKELPQDAGISTLLDINLVTDHILTIDELDRASDSQESLAYKWRITEGGENWVIVFYDVAQDGFVYKIDNQQILGNIVTVMLEVK